MSIIVKSQLSIREKVSDIEQKDESGIVHTALGGASIFAAYEGGKYTKRIINNKLATYADDLSHKLTQNAPNKNIYKRAGYEAFNNSGLVEKNVKLLSHKEILKLSEPVVHYHNGRPKLADVIKELFEFRNEFNRRVSAQQALKGKNAYYGYSETTRRIAVNMAKDPGAIFHEMGHALNHNSMGIGKILLIGRDLGKLAPLILATAILRKKKSEDEKSETLVGKGLDFVKDNCVALAAATQMPLLMEEGLASIKGYKMAKQVLPKAQLKYLAKMQGAAWSTYLCGAVAIIAGVFAADKIRNMTTIQRGKECD